MTKYLIEDGIPLPPLIAPNSPGRTKGRKNVYPLADLQVGQSFYVPVYDVAGYGQLANAVSAAKRRLGYKFAIRSYRDGWRVWRTD